MDGPSAPGMVFRLDEFSGYAMKFSPFVGERFAVAASQYFGIIGNGRAYVLEVRPNGVIECVRVWDTKDGLYDVTWSEENENQFVACSGDGSIKMYDMGVEGNRPVMSYAEHEAEVYSVSWDLQGGKEHFVSSAWDCSIRLWDSAREESLMRFIEHTYCVYEATWAPNRPRVFASASGDCTFKMWDTGKPRSALTVRAHDFEVLSCDWNKYNDFEIATASVDKSVRVWDIRKCTEPLVSLHGHSYAVRRVRFSPHCGNMLLSASYDMNVNTWDLLAEDPLVATRSHHTEFVVGIDWCLFSDIVGSCGWDGQVCLWNEPIPPNTKV